jgi:pimeloyl-ACP methyl ester carboxylesterase
MSFSFTSHVAEVRGVKLHYLLGGDPEGAPVLLWHGFLSTGHVWRKVMPALADAGLAVLVPDMRGYGDSDRPDGVDGYDGRALAEDFRALVAQIGFGGGRPITLVAHDMGAPPALLWAADHPEEVARLFYIEVPVMLPDVLEKIIAYTPQAAATGSMWWWLLPLAPGVPEALIVGNERAFLDWFFDRSPSSSAAIDGAARDEVLRSFAGREGVLGALGVYRAAFVTMEQTVPLLEDKIALPVVALGGAQANGERVRAMVERVASDVSGGAIEGGHFLPEERPEAIVAQILGVTSPTEGAAT